MSLLNMLVIALFTLGVTFHAWCVIYAVLRFLHKSSTLYLKNIARYCNKVSMKSFFFYVFCNPSMERGFQAFSKETVLSVFTLSSVKEEFFVKFLFCIAMLCACIRRRKHSWLCSAFYPSPIIPVVSIH